MVLNRRSSAYELVPMGAILTVINPAKHILPKLDDNCDKICHFLGYDNHVKTRYYWSPDKPYDVGRVSQCVIDDVATFSVLQHGFVTVHDDLPTPLSIPLHF